MGGDNQRSLDGGAASAVTVRGANFAPTGRALACRFGEQVVTAEFVNVSVVRCVPPATARPTTVPFSVAHDYEHDSPLPALRIDPDTVTLLTLTLTLTPTLTLTRSLTLTRAAPWGG